NVPGAHIADTTISLSSGQDRFTLAIDVPSGQVDLLKQILPTLLIKYNLKYETQIGRKNVIAVTYDEVRQSNLYKNLQGFGSTAYVARDDLRKLSLDVRKVVNINATIEDPETFDQNIFKTVLDFL